MQRYARMHSKNQQRVFGSYRCVTHSFRPEVSEHHRRRHRVCHDMTATNRSPIGSWQHLGAVLSLPTRFISGLTRVKYRCRLCKILYE